MNFYEVVYITRPDVATNQVDQSAQRFTDVVTSREGKIITTEQWGLRTLAYTIRKHKKGYYTMLGIQAGAEALQELERLLNLSDDVVRHHVVKVDHLTEEPSAMLKQKSSTTDEDAA